MPEDNPLRPAIEELLSQARTPFTEYDLIQALKERGLVAEDYSLSPLSLFRVHFCVFNALYQLQDDFVRRNRSLVISPLAIYSRELEVGEGDGAPAEREAQPLREYYLDWEHYREATGESVEELLQDFWRAFARRGLSGDGDRRRALAELGLEEPASPAQIKQRYRRLAMEHHPDRGGSGERLRRINAALAVLEDKN